MGFFDKVFGKRGVPSQPHLQQRPSIRAVPGALTYTKGGAPIYNLLTPHMGQFMGRCIGAIKKDGIAARGTGQFSILVGQHGAELRLDMFYQPKESPKLIEEVLCAARQLNGNA